MAFQTIGSERLDTLCYTRFCAQNTFRKWRHPPLYYSQNESTLQWIGEKDWIFKCIFDVDSIMLLRKKIELQFARLDTYAKLSLNGTLLGETNNAFRTWKFECKQLLKASGNELIVHFTSTQRKSQEIYQKSPTALPGEIRVVSENLNFILGGILVQNI